MTTTQSVKNDSLSGTCDSTIPGADIEDEEFDKDLLRGRYTKATVDGLVRATQPISWTPPTVVWTSFYPTSDQEAHQSWRHAILNSPLQPTCQRSRFHIRSPRLQEHYNPDTIMR